MCWVLTLWVHSGVQHSSQSMQSHQSCTLFFWIVQSSGRSFLSISCSGLCFGSGGGVFLTFTRLVSSASAIHAKVVGESASAFLRGEFAVLSEFIGEVGLLVLSGGTGQVRIGPLVRRRRGGFVVGGLIFWQRCCGIGGLVGLLFTRLVIGLLGFLGNFRLMFPVVHINLLNQLVHSREHQEKVKNP